MLSSRVNERSGGKKDPFWLISSACVGEGLLMCPHWSRFVCSTANLGVSEEKRKKSRQQVELSQARVMNLLSDGMELITNVKVAADAKESQRRTDLREARRLQVEKLESEARSGMEKFEEITKGWGQAKTKLKCQTKEVDLLIERMEEQMESLTRARRQELEQVEKEYEEERKILLTGNTSKWEQAAMARETKESERMTQRRSKTEEYETMLQKLSLEGIEEYNLTKDMLEWKQQPKYGQLTQEKQEYNIQVLKEREKDDILFIIRQKRKNARLYDIMSSLKVQVAAEEEAKRLDDDSRHRQQRRHAQKTNWHFEAVDGKRLRDLWQMNEEEVRELAERALDIDRLLYAAGAGRAGEVSPGTVKRLLQLLCDEAGFLVESQLLKLLTPLDKDSQSFIKLDSIFSALGIRSQDDVYRLAEFFSNYRHQQTQQADAEEPGEGATSDLLHPDDVLAALKAFTAQYTRPGPTDPNSPGKIREHQSPATAGTRPRKGPGEAAAFWDSLANAIPESRLSTWTALDRGLEKYHTVLRERWELSTETQALQRKNQELRMLLSQAFNSKVNSELEIPPTQLMKMIPQ
ncbi:hypothetical protein NHX12_026426 [Muraenolepis orangiensis]|uniref:Dynein regulatory complex protein 1 n=1 Tax=Muraenolepis orangiensis TaxID=630683 RepID=A0A9Q0IQS3_9TELE|nr:hypothetical protein NHX12_026426 [Muraenolepis orangiensis]